jgi:hypothetical protein
MEDFKGLEYSFYTARENPDDPALKQVGSSPLIEIEVYPATSVIY